MFEVLLHAVRQPAQSGEEPCRASWEPTWPYQVQVQRCLQSELGFCHLQPKHVLRPETHFQSRACKEIWRSSFQERHSWQGLPSLAFPCPHLQTDSDQKPEWEPRVDTGRRRGGS